MWRKLPKHEQARLKARLMRHYTDLMGNSLEVERGHKMEHVQFLKAQIDRELDKSDFQNVFSGQGNFIRDAYD